MFAEVSCEIVQHEYALPTEREELQKRISQLVYDGTHRFHHGDSDNEVMTIYFVYDPRIFI